MTMTSIITEFASMFLMLAAALAASAAPDRDSWAGFRDDGGSVTSSTNLPVTWSPNAGVAWRTALIGYGQSAPVVRRGRVFTTSVDGPMKETAIVTAIDAGAGKPIWVKRFPTATRMRNDYSASRAAPTPLVDDAAVYAFFESGDLRAFDAVTGEPRWERNLAKEYGEPRNNHGLGASPAQTADAVIVLVDHDGPSYLVGIDKKTGRNLWKTDRTSRKSWASPVVFRHDGKELIAISSGGSLDILDAVNGERLVSVDGISGNAVPSVSVVGSRIYVGAALGRSAAAESAMAKSNRCYELARTAEGKLELKAVWEAQRALCDYASPLVHEDRVYLVNKSGVVFGLDAVTGAEKFAQRLANPCWATPIGSPGRVYVFGKDGVTTVLATGPEFKKLAENRLWDPSNPPEQASEAELGDGAAYSGKASRKDGSTGREGAPKRGGPGDDMTARLWEHDRNGDGRLGADEIPERMKGMLSMLDADQDGVITRTESDKAAERFRLMQGESRRSVAGTVVYGVAAAGDAFYVRTGKSLWCVRAAAAAPAAN